MKLLIVTEHYALGGLETYINTQAEQLASRGWQLHLACGSRFNASLAGERFASVHAHLDFNAGSSLSGLLATVERLCAIIREQGITAVHAHPFTTLLPALLAAARQQVPMLASLHGPASVTGFYGPVYEYVLAGLVTPHAARCLAVSPEVQALAGAQCGHQGLALHPNGVTAVAPAELPAQPAWLVASRLDADKVPAILDFIRYARQAGIGRVDVAGDGTHTDWLAQAAGEGVQLLGARNDVAAIMHAYEGVAGMGRVVLEGAAAGRPVCLLGYDGVKGMLNEHNWAEAARANFSGRNLVSVTAAEFARQWQQAQPVPAALLPAHSAEALWQQLDEWLASEPQNNDLLQDLLLELEADRDHRGQGSKPWLHGDVLFNAAGRVVHAPQHFTPQRAACLAFYAGLQQQQQQQQQAAQQQAQLQALEARITESFTTTIKQVEQNMKAELERQAWFRRGVLTLLKLPAYAVQFVRLFIQSPSKAVYKLAKFVYWRLPAGLRQHLDGAKHGFLRRFGRGPARAMPGADNRNDLSWKQFREQVLARREQFPGVFVQEVVIDWDVPLYQRPQHIACALGRLGYLVIYKTLNFSHDNVNGFREVAPNVWLTNSRKVNDLTGVVRSFYSTAYSLPPETIHKLDPSSLVMYEYIDHIDPAISGDDENIRRLLALKEFAFNGGADVVVASAKKLEAEALEAVGPEKVILAQNGVDTRHYRDPAHLHTELPESLRAFREKYSNIVGYFGALAPWLWYEVVEELVTSRPDLGFVFIGPDYYGGADKLVKAENVLYLGSVDYKVLPAYARQFDVCFIPFAPSEIARTTSPLKLFEYFALEKPVVVTSEMLECVVYDEVFHAASASGFSAAIDQALAIKDDAEFRQRMATLADNNDWDNRARAMASVFEQLK